MGKITTGSAATLSRELSCERSVKPKSLWDSYKIACAPASKTYAASGTSRPLLRARPGLQLRSRVDPTQSAFPATPTSGAWKQARQGAPDVGCRHAGPRPRLLRGRGGLHLRLRTALDSDAFSSREPVSASLENALEEHNHDLRLFTRRSRLRGPAVLPDLRAAAARAVLTALPHRSRKP